MLCVLILYTSCGTYSLKPISNDRFFEKLFMAIFIYSQNFCRISAERESTKKYFSYFVSKSNKPTHYLLDHGKTFIKIAWHEPNDMPTSSATSLIVIRWLSKLIFFIASMFSLVVNVLGRPRRLSPLTSSQPSIRQVYLLSEFLSNMVLLINF